MIVIKRDEGIQYIFNAYNVFLKILHLIYGKIKLITNTSSQFS